MLGKKLRTEDDRIKAVAKARKKKRKKMIKTNMDRKQSDTPKGVSIPVLMQW